MAAPIIGGQNSLNESETAEVNRGVYARFPGGSPRFGHGSLDADGQGQVARMYIPFATEASKKLFVASVPKEATAIAESLAVIQTKTAQEGVGYIDFILTSVTESFNEKVQVNEVLSDQYVSYFFGQRAPLFQISGALFNTHQDDWSTAFSVLYADILRGTQAATLGHPVRLRYGPRLLTGVFISMTQTTIADAQQMTSFNASILVKKFDVFREPTWAPSSSRSVQTVSPPSVQVAVLGEDTSIQSESGSRLVQKRGE